MKVDRNFLARWFLGLLGDRVKPLVMREVGFCRDMESKNSFARESLSYDGFLGLLGKLDLGSVNLFMGIGFWLASSGLEPSQEYMLYDRISFDFDSEEDPQRAVDAALHFSSILTSRYRVDPIVFRSGFKGAHVVIPLSRPTDWVGYQLLWDHLYSLIPKEFKPMVDRNMRQWNRLDRVPFTYNIKGGRRALAEIVYPESLKPSTFDWARLRGLDPGKVEIYRVELPKPTAPKTATSNTTRKRLEWVEKLVESGLPDGRKRAIGLVIMPYYANYLGLPDDQVIEICRRFIESSCKNFGKCDKVNDKWLQYMLKTVKEHSYKVLSKQRLAEVFSDIYETLSRLINSYTTTNNKTKLNLDSVPKDLALFTKDTSLTEFSYEDFRKWLESKQGSLDASTWHHYERLLREWAERGFLGRRYLVGGTWVDYGPGKVDKPPSKVVRFYLT